MPSFAEDFKVANGFGDVVDYVEWLNFMYKVTSTIRFDVLFGAGLGFWKKSQWSFPLQNRFTTGPWNETESKMENPTQWFREMKLIPKSRIKSKTIMSYSLRKKKGAHF